MIVEEQQSTLETIGDIEQVKATIDSKNLDFITSLLTSNLYSNPYRSFLREIVSNAWDSQVAAHTEDKPVIINFTDTSVTVRDYGTGLSKEDFENIYCKIGTSTKRTSNDYIGQFGIGKWSMLSLSDIAYVTSYYNNMKYEYIITKEVYTITSNLVCEENTDEPNGLSITLSLNEKNIKLLINELDYLTFFPNLYVNSDSKLPELNINNDTIVRYKTFSTSKLWWELGSNDYSWNKQLRILLGNVLYETGWNSIKNQLSLELQNMGADHFFKILHKSGAALNMPIGSVSVTPSREALIYDEKTIKAISNKISEFIEEIKSLKEKYNTIKVESIDELIDLAMYRSYLYLKPNSDNLSQTPIGGIPLIHRIMDEHNLKYKDITLSRSDVEEMYYALSPTTKDISSSSNCIHKFGVLEYGRLQRKKGGHINMFTVHKFIMLEEGLDMDSKALKYIKQRYDAYSKLSVVTSVFDYEALALYYKECARRFTENKKIIKLIYDYILSKQVVIKKSEIDTYYQNLRLKALEEAKKDKEKQSKENNILFRKVGYTNKVLSTPTKDIKKLGKVLLLKGCDDYYCRKFAPVFGLGYSVLYVSKVVYDKLYKKSLVDPKSLSNIKFESDFSVKNNLSVKEECLVVLAHFCNKLLNSKCSTGLNPVIWLKENLYKLYAILSGKDGECCYSVISEIEGLTDNKKAFDEFVYNYAAVAETYSLLDIKHGRAKFFKDNIDRISKALFIYSENKQKSITFININYYLEFARYITIKDFKKAKFRYSCISEKYYSDLPLIKFINNE